MPEEQNFSLVSANTPNVNLPAHMQGDERGTEEMGQYIVPPRVKVVQPLSDKALTDKFNPGDTILMPSMISVAPIQLNEHSKPGDVGEAWEFVPLFFFAEFICWNPRGMIGQLPAIRERSTDPNSTLAIKCRNQKTWAEACPDNVEETMHNTEHLNIIVMPLGGDMAGTPCIMSFSRSEHSAGTKFLAIMNMRKAPIFGCVFRAQVGQRENVKGKWYGMDISNPEDGRQWVTDAEAYEAFKGIHASMKESHAQGLVRPEYSEMDESAEEEATEEY